MKLKTDKKETEETEEQTTLFKNETFTQKQQTSSTGLFSNTVNTKTGKQSAKKASHEVSFAKNSTQQVQSTVAGGLFSGNFESKKETKKTVTITEPTEKTNKQETGSSQNQVSSLFSNVKEEKKDPPK